MNLADVRTLVAEDSAAVDGLIQERLRSDVVLINQVANYIVNSGGKRLRPLVVLLAARAADCPGEGHRLLAAIVELIHTATLLHDDVVDDSRQRRGHDTVNHLWGNEASVLVGDFLYTRSFQMMIELERMAVLREFSETTNTIAAGEVLQLLYVHDPDVSEARYRDVIYRKTAALFESGCRMAGHLAQAGPAAEQGLADYGRHLGMAFQLIDDALDYAGDAEAIGKNLGDDLAEGKPTMPLLRAIAQSSIETREQLRGAVRSGGLEGLQAARSAIANTDAIAYTQTLAAAEIAAAQTALEPLGHGQFRSGLKALADFALVRDR